MERLKKIESVVEKILERRMDARKSDDVLYMYICEYFCRGVSSMTLKDFLFNRKETACPSFESVTRARRRVFEKRPELKPAGVTEGRKIMEKVYIDYAISN